MLKVCAVRLFHRRNQTMMQPFRHLGSHLRGPGTRKRAQHVRVDDGKGGLFVRLLSTDEDQDKNSRREDRELEDEKNRGIDDLDKSSFQPRSTGKSATGPEELGNKLMGMGHRLRGRPLSPFQRVTGFMPPDFWKSKATDLGAFEMESTNKPNSEAKLASETLEEQTDRAYQGDSSLDDTKIIEDLKQDNHIDKGIRSDDDQVLGTRSINESSGKTNLFPFDLSFNLPNFKVFKSPMKQLPLKVGEPIIAELKEPREVHHFRNMWILDDKRRVNSSHGMILFEDIIGKNPGDTYVTSGGTEMIVRRPSLEEFVLYMKKITAIPQPVKNMTTALCLLDVSPGDWVLECGTGSAATTLFLSRAVGVTGRVVTFDSKKEHLDRAKLNYRLWIDSWKMSHDTDWPDNVTFHHADVINATDKLRHQVDGAFLDMLTPTTGLRAVLPLIKPGKVVACHIVNMTQVVDVAASILKHQLPVVLEQVLEVEHKSWLVSPARHLTGRLIYRPGSTRHSDSSDSWEQGSSTEEEENGEQMTGEAAYLARPSVKQAPHSGFLVKLRVYSDTRHTRDNS